MINDRFGDRAMVSRVYTYGVYDIDSILGGEREKTYVR